MKTEVFMARERWKAAQDAAAPRRGIGFVSSCSFSIPSSSLRGWRNSLFQAAEEAKAFGKILCPTELGFNPARLKRVS